MKTLTVRCLTCGEPMDATDDSLTCPNAHRVPLERGVARFVAPDDRYEGAYTGQIAHLPGRTPAKDFFYFHFVQNGIVGELRRVISPGDVVVDAGCAGGIRWLGTVAHVVGIDLSFSSLVRAAEIYDLALQSRVTELPLPDNSVDVFYSSFLFEHLPPDTKDIALSEIKRVLRPRGHLVMQFDVASKNRLMTFARRDPEAYRLAFIENDGHYGLETTSTAIERISVAGFDVDRMIKFGTNLIQYSPVYEWLDKGYGSRYRGVAVLGRVFRWLNSSRLGLLYHALVTLICRATNRWTDPDAATSVIVVGRSSRGD